MAALHKALRVWQISPLAFGLDIRTHRTALIRTLVPVEAAVCQCLVNYLRGVLHETVLIGILDAQQEFPAKVTGDAPGIQRGAEISNVHVARGARRKARPDLALRNARFHFFKVFLVHDSNCSCSVQLFTVHIMLFYYEPLVKRISAVVIL